MPRLVAGWVLAALLAAPAAAEPLDTAPVLTLAGPGAATFTLDSPVSLDYADARVSGVGRYAGVEVFAASGRTYGGVLTIPELDRPAPPLAATTPTTLASGVVTLPAGRYRAYVLSDAAVEVRLPLRSGHGVTVAASRPVPQSFHADGVAVETGRTSLALRHPVTTSRRTFVLGRYGPGVLTSDVEVHACVTRRGTACGTRNGVIARGAAVTATQAGLGTSWQDARAKDARVEATVAPDARGASLTLAVLQYVR